MKRVALAVLALLCVAGVYGAKKQKNSVPEYKPLPAIYDGTMASLDTLGYESLEVPDTLKPLFVNYLSRHGARYLSSRKKTETLEHVIRVAAERGVLTPEGKAFGEFLQRVDSLSTGHWGLLSPEGMAEQRFMGRWLLSQFSDLIGHGGISAISSYVPRVVQTMYALTETILTTDPLEKDVTVNTSEGRQYDSLLRFFEYDKQYEAYLDRGEWTPIYASWMHAHVPSAPAARLFTSESGLRDDILCTLSMHIYGVLQSLRCSGIGVPTTQWMSEDEYRRCWEAENLDKYLRRTWTSVSDEPARAAAPLLMAVISAMDEAARAEAMRQQAGQTRQQAETARMYFGHAETLLPLYSLMNLPGCSVTVNDWAELPSVWKDYEIIPMGGNLTVVLLHSGRGTLYAALCLNGKWLDPLRDGRKIVPYSTLRTYWLDRATTALRNS